MKNKKGGGTFTKLKNGTIEFTVSVGYNECGKRQRKKFYGKTETECHKKYREYIKEGDKPKVKPIEHTLSSWFDEWLVTYKEKKVQSSTYDEYVKLATRVKNHRIGDMKLTQIKPIHVTEFFTAIIGYSHSVRKKTRFLLTAAFECAVDNDYCSKNPVKRAEIAKKPQTKKEPFTEDEAKTIIDFAQMP
jgi:integrase